MKRLLFIPIAFAITIAASGQALRTFNSTNDLVDASHNPMSQNTNSWVISTNDMSYQLWTWWQGDTSAVGTYNLQSLRPGVVGRYKLVENLHWNHVPDVGGDTFILYNFLTNFVATNVVSGAINPTDNYLPYRQNATTFGDSPWYRISANVLGFNSTKPFLTGATPSAGFRNTLMGYDAGTNIVASAGNGNLVLGYQAGEFLKVADFNVIAGFQAGQHSTNSDNNVMIGPYAGANASDLVGSRVLIGNSAGQYDAGAYDIAIGDSALYNNYLGITDYNTAIGASALADQTNGMYNVALGYQAGYRGGSSLKSGNFNTFVGSSSGAVGVKTNTITLGYNVVATNNNEIVIGNANNVGTYLRGPVYVNGPSGSVTAGSFDVPLLFLGDVNTNLVIDFATLGFRTANLTNDSYITVTGMPATVARTLEYKIFTGNTNRNVFWQVGLSNSMGAPLPAILPSNNVVRLTLQSTGTTVTNVDAYVTWRTP